METPLLKIIQRRIHQHGPMDLGEYMALCLSHPEHGYYMTRDPFGAEGDFITAPEISQMFGEMIGMWLADLWIKMGSPPEFILLECGPGRGTLMEDIMRTTRTLPGFHQAAKIHLMEMSPYLRNAQRQKLGIYDPVWIDGLSQLPASLPLLLVANELLDALPIRQIERRGGVWVERVVGLDHNDTLCLGVKEADLSLLGNVPKAVLENGEDGVFEVSPILNQYIKSVDILLKRQNGVALFLDYGHGITAMGDTLQAVKSHGFADIFDTPGLCDLTAHVDFDNIARIAHADGIAVHGPTTQRAFLRGLGIEVRAERLKTGASESQRADLEAGLKRLIDTKQMGLLFKALALSGDPKMEVAGFHEGL